MLKRYTISGAIFVLILGAFAHFFYEWSNNNLVVGLFTPINESTWEHMKLIFFPMLIFTLAAYPKLKEAYPCIASSLLFGILVGTVLIPIIFYTYTGIIGYNLFIFDIATFVLADIIAFCTVHKLALSCKMQDYTNFLTTIVCIVIICFVLFTFYPPSIALFEAP